jgi:hypothetical protein
MYICMCVRLEDITISESSYHTLCHQDVDVADMIFI